MVSAGGTGGHILPALAIIAEKQRSPTPAKSILWVGTAGEMEEELVPRANLPLQTISGGGLHGVGIGQFFHNGVQLLRGWLQARRLVRQFRPGVLLLTGGYTNGPLALAAWEQRVPMLIFLPDIEPGLAIKTLGWLASCIACTAEASTAYLPAGKAVATGYPVRTDLTPKTFVGLTRTMSQAQTRSALGLKPHLPTLLVFGGSRGARTINYALMDILASLLADYQIIHISGRLDWDMITQQAGSLPAALRVRYRPYPYLYQDMGQAFRAADLAVSRAGAATLGEFPAVGLPAILIPYPYAWRYQKVNADYLVGAGAAVRLDDKEMATQLAPTIRRLMDDTATLEKMRRAAIALHRPGAARRVADLLTKLAGANE